MQSIFDKFSLQNLLRQFFCGFVFIASFCFFASGNATDDLTWPNPEGLLKEIHWEQSQLITLAVVACKEPSILVAILILLPELLFDWHRDQPVLAISKP